MGFRSYRDLGAKKGYWRRVQGLLTEYLDGKITLDTLVQNISEEPRARGDELWEIFTSIRPLDQAKIQLLKRAEKTCIRLGFISNSV